MTMTYEANGEGLWWPRLANFPLVIPPSYGTTLIADASGEKIAMVGRFFHPDRAAGHTIDKVMFRFGTSAINAASDIQVSLQDVSTTTAFPDESVDQSGLVGQANVVSNTIVETTLSTARTVNQGTLFGVVWEYSAFTAADSFIINALSTQATGAVFANTHVGLKAAAGPTWSVPGSLHSMVAFHCSDTGDYGTFLGAYPPIVGSGATLINTHTYNSGSNPNEYALVFQRPYAFSMAGAYFLGDTDGDLNLNLYNAAQATQMTAVAQDKDNRYATALGHNVLPFPSVSLSATTDYYLTISPSSATSLSLYSMDFPSTAVMKVLPGGDQCRYATRNGGAWTETSTRLLLAGILQNGVDIGGGGGGVNPFNGLIVAR